MSVPIKVPDLGAADDNVTIVRWLVDEGAAITRGQKIVAIETDKAVIELESVAAGILLKKCAADGDDATVGDVVAIIGNAGESLTTNGDDSKSTKIATNVDSRQATNRVVTAADARGKQKLRVSPMVRNFAKQQGVDLDQLVGTGPGGVITRQDVICAVKRSSE